MLVVSITKGAKQTYNLSYNSFLILLSIKLERKLFFCTPERELRFKSCYKNRTL